MAPQTNLSVGIEWDVKNPSNAYVSDGKRLWYLTDIKDIRIESPELQPVHDSVVTYSMTFHYEFTVKGKENDNAPDSVRPDLHT